jgi:hypothetical protein
LLSAKLRLIASVDTCNQPNERKEPLLPANASTFLNYFLTIPFIEKGIAIGNALFSSFLLTRKMPHRK